MKKSILSALERKYSFQFQFGNTHRHLFQALKIQSHSLNGRNTTQVSLTNDPLEHFNYDKNRAEEIYSDVTSRRKKNREICVCGHPMRLHSSSEQGTSCLAAKTFCPCTMPIPVLRANDHRYFTKISRGAGAKHALFQGMYASIKAGKEVNWLSDPMCFKCGKEGLLVRPIPLNRLMKISFGAGEMNLLACDVCAESFRY